MGMDANNCWLGNYCMDKSSGGCPPMTGLIDHDNDLDNLDENSNDDDIGDIIKAQNFTLLYGISGSGSMDYGSNDYGSNTWTSSGSGSSCFDAYTQV